MDQLDDLATLRGSSTGLLSYIIPAGATPEHCRAMLRRELATAANIKDPSNRRSVQESLRAASALVEGWSGGLDHGLCVFAGSCI